MEASDNPGLGKMAVPLLFSEILCRLLGFYTNTANVNG
jgi:hypothetical protein